MISGACNCKPFFLFCNLGLLYKQKKRLFKITGLFCRSIGVTPTKPHGDRKCSLSNKLPSQTRITGFWDITNRKSASIIHMDGRLFKPCHFGRAFFILQFRVIVQTDHQPTAPCGCIACTITLNLASISVLIANRSTGFNSYAPICLCRSFSPYKAILWSSS